MNLVSTCNNKDRNFISNCRNYGTLITYYLSTIINKPSLYLITRSRCKTSLAIIKIQSLYPIVEIMQSYKNPNVPINDFLSLELGKMIMIP